MGKFFTRIFIVFSWILLIAILLYFPSWQIFPFKEKSINLFVWGDILDPKTLSAFEKETNIKVYLSYYATNEELQVKMKATKGENYDLIMPSDYAVSILIKEELLKPLNRKKLLFWNDLNPSLLNHSYDPENQFSIPFEWEIYGLGIDKNFFSQRSFEPSWKAIYDPKVIDYTIAVGNDPIEAIAFASLYLYEKPISGTIEEFEKIRQLLLQQRKWVEAYSEFRADYFIATGNCPVALTMRNLIKRIQPFFPSITFIIPKEGTFISIENFCIPKATKKEQYVYQLLNYLYAKESMIAHYDRFLFFPATLSPIDDLDLEEYEKDLLRLPPEEFSKFRSFKKIFSNQKIRDLWVEVKSF